MHPKLFEIGPIPVYSYGLMLGIAFLLGSSLFSKELKRNKIDENAGVMITFLAIIGGIIGGKIFYILEEWNFGFSDRALNSFFKTDVLFSPSGLTFYGGLILSMVLVIIYCRKKNLSIMLILDALSPGAIIGYGIARIGCHLSGDGCYGVNVNGTFWEFLGCNYSNGIVPTKAGELVLPTPLIELGAAVIIFFFLWSYRKHTKYYGQLFYYYLILSGLERLLIEFVRLNPKVVFGLSQAQLISILMIIAGIIMIIFNRTKNENIKN
jgi:phosphatidylglycerol---prolipoprotein diacylglyceryl transferase